MAKKGITAVVAIVLLLMMTVAAAGLAYMWVGGLQQGAQQTGTEGVNKAKEQAQTSLSVDSMWNGTSGAQEGNITISLRNTGSYAFADLGASGTAAYVDGQANSVVSTNLAGTSLAPNEVKTINTGVLFPAVGQVKSIRIVTPAGYELSFKCRATVAGAGKPCQNY